MHLSRGLSVKTPLPAVLLALLIFCGAAAAQEYQIRAGANINLRDTYSLEGAVVETVPSGTILQVVGQFNRWLKIDRNGNTLWMANWVSHSHLTGGEGGQPLPQSQIDNCCFVNRQCTVDAEWVSGYWAFQKGQCTVPEQTKQSTSLQPTSAVAIDGPEHFVFRVEAALALLKNRSPEWYAYVTSGLDKIRLIPDAGRINSFVSLQTRTFSVLQRNFDFTSGKNAALNMAGGMVHEACHVHRYETGLQPGGYEGEKACLTAQIEALEAVDPLNILVLVYRSVLEDIDDPEFQWWH